MNAKLFRVPARIISALFHPLLILTYMLILLMLINPYAFGVHQLGEGRSDLLIIYVFLTTFLIPGMAITMMRTLALIPSLAMEDRRNRIGPFIATGVLYLWLYISFSSNPELPIIFKSAILGSTIALFVAFFLNLFSRISLHAVGMGALVGLITVAMLLFSYRHFQIGDQMFSMYGLLFVAIILAGLVGSARLILDKPEPINLYGGYLVGFATQVIALQFLL